MSYAAFNGNRRVPPPANEPVALLRARIARARVDQGAARRDGRRDASTSRSSSAGRTSARATPRAAVMPHDHRHVLADYHKATPDLVAQAVDAALAAHREWSRWSFEDRAAVLLQGRRAPDDHVARHVNARDDARAVEDGLSGRDRLGVRDHRLLALQRALRAGSCSTSSRSATTRCGTSSSTARSRGSSTRSRRSTSRRSPPTCRPPRRSWATPSSGSRRRARCSRPIT